MSQDIHTHLEKLKTELNKLEPAVKHLQKADENATALISSLSNIHKEFSKHLQSIEKSLSDANEKHQKQLTKEIQESTKKINDATELLSKSNSTFEKQIKNLLSEYSGLGDATAALIKKIESVDFPSRLSTIDKNIQSVNSALNEAKQSIEKKQSENQLTLLKRLDAVESKNVENHTALIQRLDQQDKVIKLLKTVLFVICGLIVIGTVATIFVLKQSTH